MVLVVLLLLLVLRRHSGRVPALVVRPLVVGSRAYADARRAGTAATCGGGGGGGGLGKLGMSARRLLAQVLVLIPVVSVEPKGRRR